MAARADNYANEGHSKKEGGDFTATPKVTLKGTIKRLREMKKRHRADQKALEDRIAILEKSQGGKAGEGDDDDDEEDDDDEDDE